MVVLGVDTHKHTHTLVAVDLNGRPLGQLMVAASPSGHLSALGFAEQFETRTWALRRRLSDEVFRRLLADIQTQRSEAPTCVAAAA